MSSTERSAIIWLALLAWGCAGDPGPAQPDAGADSAPRKTVFGGERPVALSVPASYDPARATPLVFVLHGFGASGYLQEILFGYRKLALTAGFLLASPDGTVNSDGKRFWNATPACCGDGASVNDVGYLDGLIDEISAEYNVDPRRVYFVGHSNGGFMAYRMACDRASRVAAIVSLAGATFYDRSDCKPADPVSVLQIHGDGDLSVLYEGGQRRASDEQTKYPGALETVEAWAEYDGCAGGIKQRSRLLDIDDTLPGTETTVQGFDGCPTGIGVELWTIEQGGHLPDLSSGEFARLTWQWLAEHQKPAG